MSFKDDYQEYKQRKEARDFFNANNQYYLKPIDYAKAIVVGLAVAIIPSIILNVIRAETFLGLAAGYILVGHLTGLAISKAVKYGNTKTGIIAAITFVLGTVISYVIYAFISVGYFMPQLIGVYFTLSIEVLLSSIYDLLFIACGTLLAFQSGKD